VRCPAHDDRTASLSVSLGKDGETVLMKCHVGCDNREIAKAAGFELRDLFAPRDPSSNGAGQRRIVAAYDYVDAQGAPLFEVVRFEPKDFRQRRPDGNGGWVWSIKGIEPVLYHLPEIIASDNAVWVCEGEKDADRLRSLGLIATTAPMGAGKWRQGYTDTLAGREVVLVPHNDEPGRRHMDAVAAQLHDTGCTVTVVNLPGLDDHGDVSDWLDAGFSGKDLIDRARELPEWKAGTLGTRLSDVEPERYRRVRGENGSANGQHDHTTTGKPLSHDSPEDSRDSLQLDDFFAYLPKHKYIFRKDGSIWDPAGVNAGLPPVLAGIDEVPAGRYLDKTRAVHQMTWIPGQPELIRDALVTAGGLTPAPGKRAYNRYRPPESLPGDPMKADPWLAHIERLYPDDADHIVSWLAHRVQHPGVKINHALVLGGTQGIGKDTLLDPVIRAVGAHNVADESPATVTGRFNKFLCSVILRVSEARDLGDVDRYGFYEHMKAILAVPPDVLSVELKFIDAYPIPNVVGVIFTTNNRHNGLYLPAEDRRHYVAWSELAPSDFDADYFERLYAWYEADGNGHVAAYLRTCDLSDFNPKAPPPKTDAFWDMVDTGRSPEEAELRDLLDLMKNPEAVTVPTLRGRLDSGGELWALFNDRKFRTQIPHRMADVGYIPVRNPYAKDGHWTVGGKRVAVYALATLSKRDRIAAAGRLS
jgi:hypothetical protein